MNLNSFKSIYFLGIGGIGMSALADYFYNQGLIIGGYDKTQSQLTDSLVSKGIEIIFRDSVNLIGKEFRDSKNTLIIITPAINGTNKILNFFTAQNFMVVKRAEVLGIITSKTRCLAVAGTHGKTTTSSILAHLMFQSNKKIYAFLGGISMNFASNFFQNGSDFSVVEADEFDKSFLHLRPEIACITSIDSDHMDTYGDKKNLENTFKDFSNKLVSTERLFVHDSVSIKGVSYGVDTDTDYSAKNITYENGFYVFDLKTPNGIFKEFKLPMPGRHNLSNAVVALAMALYCGCNENDLKTGLESYMGVERRFSYIIKRGSLVFIDDYAHHPREIEAVEKAIREIHPGKKITAVFQPHLYSRTRDHIDDFAEKLSNFDAVLLLDIYPARELPIDGVNSKWLLKKIKSNTKQHVKKENLFGEITKINNPVLVTMGAGDISLEVSTLSKMLTNA